MNYTKAILDQNSSLKKENAKLMHENIELKNQISKLKQIRIGVVSGSYGCPNYGSKDIEEIGSNHHQTKDEMDFKQCYK